MKKLLVLFILAAVLFPVFGSGKQESSAKAVAKLNFISWYSTETDTYESVLLKDVAAQLPEVSLTIEPAVWDTMHPLLQARIASKSLPDILDFKGQDIAKYGSEKLLLDLTGQPWLSEIPAAARENLKIGGKDYGMPYSALFQGVLFNREIFKKYNLKVPTTYAELMNVAKVLKANGVTPFAAHFADTWNIGNITMQFAMSEVFNVNPSWGKDLYAGKVAFETSPEYRRVFEHVKDIMDNSWSDIFSVDFSEATNRFGKGEAAMFITGTWANRNLREYPSLDFGIFPFPGQAAGARLIFEPNHTWAISADTKNPEAALSVLGLVAKNKDLAKVFVGEAGAYSLLNGVTPAEPYPCDSDIDMYKAGNKIVDVSIGNNQIKWAFQEEYSRYITEWLLGKMSLDDALKAATAYKAKISQ